MNSGELTDLLISAGFVVSKIYDSARCATLMYTYDDGYVLFAVFPKGDDTYYNVMLEMDRGQDRYNHKEKYIVFGAKGPLKATSSRYKSVNEVDRARFQLAKYLELV